MAGWLGLDQILVGGSGGLAGALSAERAPSAIRS